MDGKLSEKSCAGFTAELASAAPVPGGGGVTALLGALSASLCAMAANLSCGRAKDPAVAEALAAAAKRAESLRLRQLEMIDADAAAFAPLARAYALPKDAPNRAEILRRLSREAGNVPLEMLRLCAETTSLLEQLLDSASRMLLSDVGCAAAACRAAVDCAAINVWVNTRGYREDPQAQEQEHEVKALRTELLRRVDAVTQAVMAKLVN